MSFGSSLAGIRIIPSGSMYNYLVGNVGPSHIQGSSRIGRGA